MTNNELFEQLQAGEHTIAALSADEWRGCLFERLKTENIGTLLIKTRPFYDGALWNESVALTLLQVLDGVKVVQSDWAVLTHRCPEILDDDFMHRLYSPEALALAAEKEGYLPPDKSSVGEVVLELMTQAVVHVVDCAHCGGH